MKPLISIVVMTYFHEFCISKALESILCQKTQYSYEIIVADDASKDRTRDIVNMYKEKYPNVFRCIFNEENIGIPANMYNALCQCNGKYITFLSGDDYWIGETSLEQKIQFMERHSEYYALCSKIEARLDGVEVLWKSPSDKYLNKELTMEMYLKGVPFHTHGMILRNELHQKEGREYYSLLTKCSKYIDDATLCLLVLNRGRVYSMNILAYVYKVDKPNSQSKSFNSTSSYFERSKKQIDLYNNVHKYLPHIDLFQMYKRCLAVAIPGAFVGNKTNELKYLFTSIPNEYKNRGLLLCALTASTIKATCAICKKIKNKIILSKMKAK